MPFCPPDVFLHRINVSNRKIHRTSSHELATNILTLYYTDIINKQLNAAPLAWYKYLPD